MLVRVEMSRSVEGSIMQSHILRMFNRDDIACHVVTSSPSVSGSVTAEC